MLTDMLLVDVPPAHNHIHRKSAFAASGCPSATESVGPRITGAVGLCAVKKAVK